MAETIEQRVTRHESCRLWAYDDATGKRVLPGEKYIGKLTIGIGRCLDTHPLTPEEIRYIGHDGRTQPITIIQAVWLLRRDLAECRRALNHALSWAAALLPLRQEVLIEMIFQMGIGGLLTFKHTLALIEAGQYDESAGNMMQSKWAREDSPARAKELADLMRKGTF